MAEVIGVRFKNMGKVYYFDPNGGKLAAGDRVVVETSRGVECGEVAMANRDVADDTIVQPLKKVIRKATKEDLRRVAENEIKAKNAFVQCEKKIAERGLEMKLVDVEYTFDNSKILFYFTADGRVDFRELVKDLAGMFRTRIELRQIGVRDEAKMIGGLGTCGRELCCCSYLEDFHPVSINMAKDQNLSLNPAKISGVCGRLMCCLKYEHEAYAELQKVTPKQGSVVDTPEGRGKVISTQMLRGTCKVQLDDSPEHTLTEFQCADCCTVKGVCRNRHNQAAMAEERRKREEQAAAERAAKEQAEQPGGEQAAEQAAEAEKSAEGTAAPRRRRRRGGRRRRKPSGEGAASGQPTRQAEQS